MNPSRLFILRPVATSLLMVAILLAGAIAYRLLPLSALPEVDYPTIQVVTFYPGASPDVTTSSITAPLERQLGQMPGLKQMSSTSSGGASVITLQFSLELTLDVAEQEVQAAINAGSNFLPADLPAPPVYSKVNPADAPILTLGITSKTMPLPQVQNLVDTRLAQKISQLPGVGLVTLSGGQRPAVRVQGNPRALAANGLGLEDVRIAIASANGNQAKGSFDGPRRASTHHANDQRRPAAQNPPVVVRYRHGALVVMVIFLFLRTAAGTLIPSIAVPLSLVGTFGVMYLAGFSVNNLTLMALTIATGFVVDDAIVMIENIARYVEEGEPPLQAALRGDAQLGARPADGDAVGLRRHARAERDPLCRRPQGLLPAAGYGRDPGYFGGAAVDLLHRDGRAPARPCPRDPAGPRRGEHLLLHRRGRCQHHAQQRPRLHQPEAQA